MINLDDYITTLTPERQQQVRVLVDEFIKSLDDPEISIEKLFINYWASYPDDYDDYMGIDANFKAF